MVQIYGLLSIKLYLKSTPLEPGGLAQCLCGLSVIGSVTEYGLSVSIAQWLSMGLAWVWLSVECGLRVSVGSVLSVGLVFVWAQCWVWLSVSVAQLGTRVQPWYAHSQWWTLYQTCVRSWVLFCRPGKQVLDRQTACSGLYGYWQKAVLLPNQGRY